MGSIRQWLILPSLWFCITLYTELPVSALEIKAETGLMVFNAGVENLPELINPDTEYNFIGSLEAEQQYNDLFSLEISLEHDPVLWNRFFTRLGIHTRFFNIYAGPFVGVFNSSVIINPGLSLIFQGNISSLIFGSFQIDSTLNGGVNKPGDYAQNNIASQIGFGLPFVSPGLGMSIKIHTKHPEKQDNFAIITTKRTHYYLSVENQEKIWLFSRIRGTLGYHALEWTAQSETRLKSYYLQSVYAGFDLGFQILPALNLYIHGEFPVYNWFTPKNIPDAPSSPGTILYEFTLGIHWSFEPRKF
jgi:hypothetical protein